MTSQLAKEVKVVDRGLSDGGSGTLSNSIQGDFCLI